MARLAIRRALSRFASPSEPPAEKVEWVNQNSTGGLPATGIHSATVSLRFSSSSNSTLACSTWAMGEAGVSFTASLMCFSASLALAP